MKRMKSSVAGAALLVLLLAVMAGCGGSPEPKPRTGTEPARPAAADNTNQSAAKPADGVPASGKHAIVAGESKASYAVKEVFLLDSLNNTAIGTTTAIKGDLVLENGTFKPSTVVVDVTQLKSDKGMRDNVLKSRALETATYATAEFTIAGIEGDPVSLKDGQEASFKLTGNAKIHGVEKPLTWDAKAKAEGDTVRLTATTEFKLSLFGIDPPDIAGRIRVDDGVVLKVDLVAKK